jgi:hypothetical protein
MLSLLKFGCLERSVHHRPHQLRITFSQESPAYLDELYPITLTVTNLDERELDIVVDVLLQPGEDDSGAQC